jgi:subtilisin family serine protease
MKNIFLIIVLILISFATLSATKIYIKLKPEYNNKHSISDIINKINISQPSSLVPLKKYETSLAQKIKKKSVLASEINNKLIQTEAHLLRTYSLMVDKNINILKKMLKKIKSDPRVEYAEIVVPARLDGISSPDKSNNSVYNDPMIPQQRMLETINAFAAWDIFDGSEDIVIGISDGGTMQEHEDLKDNLANFKGEIPDNGKDDDGNGYIDDYNGYNMFGATEGQGFGKTYNVGNYGGHGTNTAGIAGATVNNGKGIAGVGGKCKIFPIKISPFEDAGYISNNYESIIMAADRGLDVLNCSWGGNSLYSPVEQSIIDYAVARDVVIIASSGNSQNNTQNDLIGPNYFPAGYNGVLSVMSSSPEDFIYGNGFKGDHHRIIAPGQKSISTSIGSVSSYESNLSGTSFASPIVSGAAGLARARHPDLSANQIIEFIRQCSDDISGLNAGYKDLISGRLNLEKVVSLDPMTMPGLRLVSKEIFSLSGEKNPKSKKGDTIRLRIKLKNYLADSGKLKITMRSAFEFQQNTVKVLSEPQEDIEINAGEEIVLDDFIVKIEKSEVNYLVLRLDIESGNGYQDFIKTTIVPTSEVTDFENDYYIVSMQDEGKIGFNGTYYDNGMGIYSKKFGNFLFDGGIFVSSLSESKAVSASHGNQGNNWSDFGSISGFYDEEIGISIFDDSKAQSTLGVKITEEMILKQGNDFVKIKTKLESDGGTINNPSVAWFFDFDVANITFDGFSNKTKESSDKYFSENENISSQLAFTPDEKMWLGVAVVSAEDGAKAVSAGFSDNNSVGNIQDLINSMKTGSQDNSTGDITLTIGINFAQKLESDSELECSLCIATAQTESAVTENLKDCIDYLPDSVSKPDESNRFLNNIVKLVITEDQSLEIISLEKQNLELSIFNIRGKLIYSKSFASLFGNQNVDFDFENGVYLVNIRNENASVIKKINILK